MVRSNASTLASRVPELHLHECRTGTYEEIETVFRSIQPTTVVHLAAAGVVSRGEDAYGLIAGNVDFTVNLIRAASAVGCSSFIHTGSCFEYAEGSAQQLTERDLVDPFSLYGATKAASVQLALGLSKHLNLPLVVLRLFGVYGPGEAPQRLIPTLTRGLHAYQPIDLTAGTQIRDWMFIDDAAAGFCTAVSRFDQLVPHTVYNLCTGVGHTVRDVCETLADAMNRPRNLLRWGARPTRIGEPHSIVGDASRFQSAVGWEPNYELVQGIRATVELEWNSSSAAAA